MAALEELQKQRERILAEIKRRGGKDKAPNYVKQLADVEAQIRTARGTAPTGSPDPLASIPPKLENTTQGVQADATVANAAQIRSQTGLNADVTNPFGSQSTTIDPNTGKATVTQNLSPEQEALYKSGAGISQAGMDAAMDKLKSYQGFEPQLTARSNSGQGIGQFSANLTNRTSTGDLRADRARIEDEAFKRLTRNLDRQKGEERDQLEQSLANRGIPIDPNDPQYNRAMRDFNERYDTLKSNAMQDAVVMGGEEYSRDVGIGETMRANDYSQQSGTFGINSAQDQQQFANQETMRANDFSQAGQQHQQYMSDLGQLSGIGPGLQVPNFQPYQGAPVSYSPASAVYAGIEGIKQGQQAINIQRQNANTAAAAAGGSGGGGMQQPRPAGPPPPPPFM